MKNKNWARFLLTIIVIFILIFTIIFVCKNIRKNGVHTVDGDDVIYNKLSEKNYEINEDTNEIIFSGDVKIGSFCISENPEAPTEEDKWIPTG